MSRKGSVRSSYPKNSDILGAKFYYQKGFIHFLPLLIIVVLIVGFLGFLLLKGGIIKKAPSEKEASIELASNYENPFDKETQYVNPFSEYKNPFDSLK